MLEEFLKPTIPDLLTIYIGIQPKFMYFNTPLSKECKIATEEFTELLVERINQVEKDN